MIEKRHIAKKITDLPSIARQLMTYSKEYRLFSLVGQMGAGKTTFIKAICEELGVSDSVNSPTFSIINEYTTRDKQTIFHFDFYRIDCLEEAIDLGLDEYLYSGSLCFMEWAEKVESILPKEEIQQIHIEEKLSGERIFTLTDCR